MSKCIKCLLFFLFCFQANAQEDEKQKLLEEMLFTTTEKRQEKINAFKKYFPKDSIGIMKAYKIIGDYGRKHGDVLLELCEPSGWLGIVRNSKTATNEVVKTTIDSVYSLYRSKNVDNVFYAAMERHLGTYYLRREKNYAKAFEHLDQAYEFLKTVDIVKYPYKANEAHWLIYFHNEFDDYDKIISIGKELLKEDYLIKNRWVSKFIKLDIASAYRGLGILDSSDVYLKKILEETESDGELRHRGLALAYLGINKEIIGDSQSAIEYLQKGLDLLELEKEYEAEIVQFSSLLAKKLIQNNEKNKANYYLKKCLEVGINKGYKKEMPEIYKNISFVYSGIGDVNKVRLYLDSVDISQRYLKENYDSKKILRSIQQNEIERAKKEKARIVFWRNVILITLFTLFCLSMLYYFHRLQLKQQELHIAKEALEKSKKEILKFTNNLRSKSLSIEESIDTVSLLEELTILTKEEWQEFKHHFEKVYPGFFSKLQENYPNLTPAEVRFLSLKKLSMSNKEMAETLGVSDQSIRTTLHRLRKKVNLSSDEDIEVLINNL